MRIVIATGTRPNLPKVAALLRGGSRRRDCAFDVVHTGQHDDSSMYDAIVRNLGMPPPRDRLCDAVGADGGAILEATRRGFASHLRAVRPDVAVVVRDMNSTLACALGGVDVGIPLAHVEAGLRSLDPSMPEERNRIAVDDEERLFRLAQALAALPTPLPCAFPLHPRTRERLQRSPRAHAALRSGWVMVLPPLGDLDFLSLQHGASLVLTENGGVQEETTALDVPRPTLREPTERPVTIELGSNVLVGFEPDVVVAAARETLATPMRRRVMPPLWDGRAADCVLAIMTSERRRGVVEPAPVARRHARSDGEHQHRGGA